MTTEFSSPKFLVIENLAQTTFLFVIFFLISSLLVRRIQTLNQIFLKLSQELGNSHAVFANFLCQY